MKLADLIQRIGGRAGGMTGANPFQGRSAAPMQNGLNTDFMQKLKSLSGAFGPLQSLPQDMLGMHIPEVATVTQLGGLLPSVAPQVTPYPEYSPGYTSGISQQLGGKTVDPSMFVQNPGMSQPLYSQPVNYTLGQQPQKVTGVNNGFLQPAENLIQMQQTPLRQGYSGQLQNPFQMYPNTIFFGRRW